MLAVSDLRVEIAGKRILDSLTAEFAPCAAALLVGANGAGKTTLLRALAGRVGIAGGTLLLDGEAVDAGSEAWRFRRVLVEADGGYLEDFSPAEQLLLRSTLLGLDEEEGRRRAEELEVAFGLAAYRDLRASELSTGYRRRLVLALAFMSDAAFLFLDEPLNGLDVEGAASLIRILRSFTSAGGIAVVASHIIEPLLPVMDIVMEVEGGRLLPRGSAEEFSRDRARGSGWEPETRSGTFPWLARRR